MIANKWYCIAQTNTFDTSCSVNISFDATSVLFTASVKFGKSSINISSCTIEDGYVLSVRLRETESSWAIDLLSNVKIEPNVSIADSNEWTLNNAEAGSGSIIAIISNIDSKFNSNTGTGGGGDSYWQRVNLGSEMNPIYAVVPKNFNDLPVHIVSYGEVSSAGYIPGAEGGDDSGGSTVVFTPILTSGKEIAKIQIDGVEQSIYAPESYDIDLTGYATEEWVLGQGFLGNSFATSTITTLTAHDKRIKSFEDIIGIDENGDVYIKKNGDVARNFYSYGEISSGGLSTGESTGGVTRLEGLEDVYLNNLADGQVLAYDALNDKWVNKVINVSGDYLPLSGGTIKGRLTITTESGIDYTDVNVVRNGMMAYMGIQGTQGALFGYVGVNGDSKGLIVDSYGLIYDDNNTQYNLLHSGNISNYAATRSYLIYTNITVPSAGWYKIASINDGMRGMVKFHIRTDGGNYTPNDTEFTIDLGWTYNTKDRFLKMSGGYGYVSAARISSGAIELYFIQAVTSNQMLYVPYGEYCGAYQNNNVGWFSGELPKGSTDGAPNYVEKRFYGESIAGALYINGYEAIHSGNIGSYITGGGNPAVTTLARQGQSVNINSVAQNAFTHEYMWSGTGSGQIVPYYGIASVLDISYSPDWRSQLYFKHDATPQVWLRSRHSGTTWTGWYELITSRGGTINGTLVVQTTSNGGVQFYQNGINGYSNGNYENLHLNINSPKNVSLCSGGGNVLIGTTTDIGVKLYVAGNLVATGEVTSVSDERYKRIESYAEIDIETIANAPIINFKWTDREDEKVHLGSTAQYWYNTSLSNGVIPTDSEKLWTMGYGQIALAGLVSVAKKVVNHEERLQIVEKELADYKAENQILKQQLNEYRRA